MFELYINPVYLKLFISLMFFNCGIVKQFLHLIETITCQFASINQCGLLFCIYTRQSEK